MRAATRGFQVIAGHSTEFDANVPYAPFADALGSYARSLPPDQLDTGLGPEGPELVKIAPALALQVPDLQPSSPLGPEQEKRRLFEAISSFLTRQARLAPLLLIFEDLHWADETSRELLYLLARRISEISALLVLSYRLEAANSALERWLARLEQQRFAVEILLPPISHDEVGAMVASTLQLDRPPSSEFLNALYERTEGNPFFVEELLKALVDGGAILREGGSAWDRHAVAELRLPRTVREAILSRLDGLTGEARALASLAAVIGHRFAFDLLARSTAWDTERLIAALGQLIERQLVYEEATGPAGGPARYVFRHALTCDTIYGQLLAPERQVLHRRIGEALEAPHALLSASLLTKEQSLSRLAYHFAAAGNWSRAVDYASRAGDHARALYANDEAKEHYDLALESARHAPDGLTQEALGQLYHKRAQAREVLGNFEGARQDFEQALHVARDPDARGTGSPALDRLEWQTLIDLGKLWAGHRDYGQAPDYFRQALALSRAQGDQSRVARSLNALGNVAVNQRRVAEARAAHHEALKIFAGLDDRQGMAETLDLLGTATIIACDLAGAADYYHRAAGLFADLDDRKGVVSALGTYCACGHAAAWIDCAPLQPADPQTHIAEGERAHRLAEAIDWRAGTAYTAYTLGLELAGSGQFGRSIQYARTSLSIATEIEHKDWSASALWLLGWVYRELFSAESAADSLKQGLELARSVRSSYWIARLAADLARAETLLGDLDAANARLWPLLAMDESLHDISARRTALAWVELALARSAPEEALAWSQRLLSPPRHRLAGRPEHDEIDQIEATQVNPGALLLQGQALIALGRRADAQGPLHAAAEWAKKVPAKTVAWRAHAAFGHLFQLRHDRPAALQHFKLAADSIHDLASTLEGVDGGGALQATFLGSRTVRVVFDAVERAMTPERKAAQRYGGLTAREREVASLIAEGKSNAAIAAELVVRVRTVEAHISRIFAKLGFTSRAQVAVWAVEKGLARTASSIEGELLDD